MLLALALVLIVGVDGSGSRWHIPRYQYVASLLNRAGLGMSLSIALPPARRQARPTGSTLSCWPGWLSQVTARLRDTGLSI
jgi:hypothetical protein